MTDSMIHIITITYYTYYYYDDIQFFYYIGDLSKSKFGWCVEYKKLTMSYDWYKSYKLVYMECARLFIGEEANRGTGHRGRAISVL